MTNVQLLLSIGIPSVLVILGWLSNNARLASLEQRFDRFETNVEQRFNSVLDASHRDALEIMRAMTALHERVAVVEARQNT